MSYLHCHSCSWSQDDFYSEDGYNPPDYLRSWNSSLCNDDLDKPFREDIQPTEESGNMTLREVIAREYECYAKNIREMKWVTLDQWRKDRGTAVCPRCGKQDFDID